MTIDPSTIKPGDAVRVRYQTGGMRKAGVPPVEIETTVYPGSASVMVLGCYVNDEFITILEHTPARPDWADAHVIRSIGEGETCYYVQRRPGSGRRSSGGIFNGADGYPVSWETLAGFGYEITVVLDGDGNPPAPEHEWLDSDALDELPNDAVTLSTSMDAWPQWKGADGRWRQTGQSERMASGYTSREIAPARVLWTPEDES